MTNELRKLTSQYLADIFNENLVTLTDRVKYVEGLMSQVAHIDDVQSIQKNMEDLALASDLQEVVEAIQTDYAEKKEITQIQRALDDKVGVMDFDRNGRQLKSEIDKVVTNLMSEMRYVCGIQMNLKCFRNISLFSSIKNC